MAVFRRVTRGVKQVIIEINSPWAGQAYTVQGMAVGRHDKGVSRQSRGLKSLVRLGREIYNIIKIMLSREMVFSFFKE